MQTESPAQSSSLRYLKGVGPKRALALEKLGVRNLRDLFYLFPRRYEDRSHFFNIEDLEVGQTATIRGNVLDVKFKRMRRMPLLEVSVGDATGMIRVLWFNQPYLQKQFKEGQEVILYGKVENYKEKMQITSPEYEFVDEGAEEAIHAGRITPIYPLTEGLFQKPLRKTLQAALQTHLDENIQEFLPKTFLESESLIGLRQAIEQMHFPVSLEEQEIARKRVVFDELFIFELIILQRMKRLKTKYQSYPFSNSDQHLDKFEKSLPFELTSSQNQAIQDVLESCKQSYPMNRLLQGDVGSGKTMVGAFGLFLAAQNKKQGALLVPTEILAEQHYKTLKSLFKGFPEIKIKLLTSSLVASKREKLVAELKQGKLDILVGTHALLSEDVEFKHLAFLVVDEQHKFGVHQRSKLLNKNPRPHQLVMTATPIPRTLALTVYGDLELSIMKELPKGRKPIKTYWITRKKQTAVLKHILEKIKNGEQAYFIFPLIAETEKSDLRAAMQEYERLQKGVFKKVNMGIIHGKTSSEEREATMKGFMSNEIQVLVSTTVIEVGVDNPNATVMVIENAERFGLSQLHQLRGRIGRGSLESECFLFGEPKTTEGQKRLRIMTKTTDGFVIAEEDLKLRGPGDFLGTRQSGIPLFQVADPSRDYEVLHHARKLAQSLIETRAIKTDPIWEPTRKHLDNLQIQY